MKRYNSMENQQSSLPQKIDHIIYAVPDLEVGRDKFERLFGVRPVIGGRHPAYGTHNAQLSLGGETYLEIIAPDPEHDPTKAVVPFGPNGFTQAALVTWVLRAEAIEEKAAAASAAGLDLGPVKSGQRLKPDGTVIAWKLTEAFATPLAGAVPFLISWGETPHPAQAVPEVGELVGLRIEHPQPDAVRAALSTLGAAIEVGAGQQFKMIARIRTAQGEVEIQ